MVRFNDVVQILDLPVQRLLGTSALLLQLGQSGGVGRRLVGVDDPRLLPVLQAAQRLAEKALRRRRVARRGEGEVDGVPMLVDGPVEIGPLAADLHVGLVDAPAGRARPAPLPTQPFLDLGRVFLNPAVNRRMVDRDAALAHHLLEITIAHPVAAIPPDRPEHYLTLKVTPLEVRHGPLPSLALDPSRRRMARFATEPPSLTIRANVAFQARLAGRFDPVWQEELIHRLGLENLLERYPEQLSGGQQQRAAIGRALAVRPRLLLADEPTGNLDEATADDFLELALDVVAATGCAFLMVTHSARLAARLERQVRLSAGVIEKP